MSKITPPPAMTHDDYRELDLVSATWSDVNDVAAARDQQWQDMLAQQEPVAWANPDNMVDATSSFRWINIGPFTQPVYTHPAPQQADRQRVPDGWKLVPVEPTPEMLAAVVTSMDEALHGPNAEKQYVEDWKAMLAAAPEAPAPQPLTVEQISEAVAHLYADKAAREMGLNDDVATARAIERAHGITKEQK